ncbi:uncharacterized protein LOC124919676 [Impatiens glandulifera]|uniref:uncharacterized protein LOC124919676 n=1 Tax=Impatiens glandulifera TaxID=253017 RepID=UPI001FB0AC5E|nr:uncharacterized protein LOC124919676 [Impatiens glandulifera]XP_047315942.1 uncharacterized protein LOC124919676 [Impatiens glandulifera]
MYGQGNYVPPKRAQVRGPLNEHPPRAPSLHFSQGISSSNSSLAPQSFPSPAYHQPFPSAAQQGHAFQILPNAAQSFIRPPQASVQQVRDCFMPSNNYYPNVAQGMQWPPNVNQTQPHGPFLHPRIPGQIPRNPEMFPHNPLLLQSQSGIPNHPQHPAGLRPIPLPFLPPPPPPPPLTPGFLPPPPGRSSLPGQPDYVFSFPNPPLPSSPPPLSPSPPPQTSPAHSSCMDTMPSAPSCFVAGFRNNSLPLLPPPPPIPPGFLPPPPGRSIIPGQPDSGFSLPKPSLPASPPPLSLSPPPPPPPPPPVSPLHSSCIDTIPSYAPSSFVTGLKNNPGLGPDASLPGDVVIASVGFDTSSNTSISEDIMPDISQNSEVRTSQESHTIVTNLACTELKYPSPSKLANTTPDSDSDMDMEDDFTQQPREVSTPIGNITLKELDDHDGGHARNKVDNFGSSDDSMPNSSRLDTHGKESAQFATNHFPKYEASMANACNSVTNSASSKNPLESTVESLSTSFCDGTKQLNESASMVGINFENFSGQVIKSASPFRHLQDYASDNSSEEDEKHSLDDISPVASALLAVGSSSMLGLIASNSLGGQLSGSFSESIVSSLQTTPSNMGTLPKLECNEKKTFSESVTAVDHSEKSKMNQEYVNDSPSLKVSIQEDSLEEGTLAVSAHPPEAESVKPQRVEPKVDEFGRLVRQDVNSDSDDSSYVERRHGRGRSWSRSHSPNDRRRRRSPRMRKNTRSRSRSWSPNKRRSVSRSPSHRRGDDFNGDRRLKDKGHLGVCFDFRQGRCYRGASCRYMHREPGKNESRRKKFNTGQEEVKRQAMQILRDEKETVISEAVVDEAKYERHREMIFQEGKPPDNKEEDVQAASNRLLVEENHMRSIGIKDASTKYLLSPHAGDSLSEGQNTCRNGVSSGADILSSVQQSATFLDPPQMCELPPSSCTLTQASLDISDCHLHVKPTIGVSEVKSTYFVPDVTGKHSLVESKTSSIASSSFTTLQAPMTTQLSHLVSSSYTPRQLSLLPTSQLVPTNSFVENHIAADANPSAHFPPNRLPLGNDLTQQSVLGNFLHEMSGLPQATEGQHHSYSPIPKFDQRTPHLDNFKPKTAPTVSNQMNLPLAGNGPTGEFCFSWRPLQSFPPPNMYSLPGKPLMDSTMSTVSFPIDGLPTSSKQDPYSIQQQQFTSHLTDHVNASSISRYTSDIDGNDQPHFSGFSGLLDSKYSSHYNPNVSRFDQLPSSRYSLTTFKHGYDAPYSSSHALIDGQDARNLGTRPKSYLSNSNNMAEHALPPATADQYDPLFDSIEPYSASSKKQLEHGLKDESRNESGSILRSSGSHLPLDVNENSNKMLGSGAVTKSVTSENEEFGETADEEVNDVEFRSSSNQIDVTNMDENDVEIDQVKMPAKGRNSKDSRSMKLFKVALADFVKEVLKPSWRQGNMSKEAFKTIVKKTVEKVSSAMKGRRIPKTQAKINHYIDSSQRKLTKLVMGYVNKYVKT